MSASASKTESKADSTTTTTDNRIQTGNESLVAAGGSQINIQSLDADLIGKIFGLSTDTVQTALDAMGGTAYDAISAMQRATGAMGDLASDAFTLAGGTNESMRKLASESMSGAYDLASQMGADAQANARKTTESVIGFATDTNNNVFGLGEMLIKSNAQLAGQTMDTLAAQSSNLNTTLRDTLSAVLGSDNLAGSAEQSGGAAGWMARNPILAGLMALGALFGLVTLATRKK